MQRGKIRIGIIGTGHGARVHLPAFHVLPDAEVIALCGRDVAKAETLAAPYGVPYVFDDWRDLVGSSDVDAVSIAAPPELHHAMAIAALSAGKPVLCESPMARTATEAREMQRMAEMHHVAAMAGFVGRFLPARALMKELIETGFVATPTLAQVTFLCPAETANAGGLLGALGAPYVDALRWWLGEITEVAGATNDAAGILLRFASGAVATLTLSAGAWHGPGEEIRIFGTGGMLALVPDGAVWGARRADLMPTRLVVPEHLRGSGIRVVDAEEPPHPLVPPMIRLARRWFVSIRTGAVRSPSFADGLRAQEVLDAIGRSQTQHKWVDVSGARWSTPTR